VKNKLWLSLAIGGLWTLLAGSFATALVGGAFLLFIFLPACVLLAGLLRRNGVGEPLAELAGAALAWVSLCFLFLARKFVPVPLWIFDGVAALTLTACAIRFARSPSAATQGRDRVPFFERADLPWLLVVLPLIFLLPRLGNEVRVGGEVRYYGLFFVDFGNLRSIVNGLNASPGMPLSLLDGLGPMSYHWVFFAMPAWMGNFCGAGLESGGTLTLATFLGAVLFFKTLSAACAAVLRETGRVAAPWCAWGAGVGVCGLSVVYFYSALTNVLHLKWFTLGYRNHLLLQLPNSLNVFGNNTFALTLTLIAVLALVSWNRSQRLIDLAIAAFAIALVPGFSVTLVMGLAAGIVAACLLGAVRKPLPVLLAFAVAGAGFLGIFAALHFFSGRSEKLLIRFDGGQFLQNIGLGFFLVVLAVGWCVARARNPLVSLCACIVGATLAVPSLCVLEGGAAASAGLSMKTASLILALGALPCAVLIFDWWKARLVPAWMRWALALLLVAGAVNTAAYAFSMAVSRFAGGKANAKIPADYFDALTHVRGSTRVSALIIDPLSKDYQDADPTTIIGARITVLPNAYSRVWGVTKPIIEEREKAWVQWEQSGLADERLAEFFAQLGDRLLLRTDLQSASWTLDRKFGEVRVYRSLRRE